MLDMDVEYIDQDDKIEINSATATEIARKKQVKPATRGLAYDEEKPCKDIKNTKNCRIRWLGSEDEWLSGNKFDKVRWNRYLSHLQRYDDALNTIEIVSMILDYVVRDSPVAGLWFCRALETLGHRAYLERAYLVQRRIDSGFTDRASLGKMRAKILQKTHCLRCYDVFSKRTREKQKTLDKLHICEEDRYIDHYNDPGNICLCTCCSHMMYPSAIPLKAAGAKLKLVMCEAEVHKRIHGNECKKCNDIDTELIMPDLRHFGKIYFLKEVVDAAMVRYCDQNHKKSWRGDKKGCRQQAILQRDGAGMCRVVQDVQQCSWQWRCSQAHLDTVHEAGICEQKREGEANKSISFFISIYQI